MANVAEHHLAHHALVYESSAEFVAAMAPFAREGVESGERVFAASRAENLAALREELGDLAEHVELQETAEWLPRPYDRLQAFSRMVDELPAGGRLRAMCEPVWSRSDAVNRQWARYESIVNLALADAPVRFVCLYDASSLPGSILAYAAQTHPECVNGGEPGPSGRFVTPDSFLPGAPATPPPNAVDLPLEGSSFRALLAEHGRDAGLASQRVDDLVLAADEIVSNAIRYGCAPIVAQAWVADDEMICRIADGGDGIADPLAGWLPPGADSLGGWGLPIARQLSDALEIDPAASGAAVSLHFLL